MAKRQRSTSPHFVVAGQATTGDARGHRNDHWRIENSPPMTCRRFNNDGIQGSQARAPMARHIKIKRTTLPPHISSIPVDNRPPGSGPRPRIPFVFAKKR